MSINLSDNIQIGQQLPVDSRYLNGYSTWADVTTAVGGIPIALRFIGLTVNVAGVEYWWKDGITDPNLIIKSPDLPPTVLSALPFSTDHLLATNNQYVVDDVVYYLGDVYKCIADNDSIIPTNILYWAKIGPGFPIVQQPADWNSTTGNNQILNKPTIPSITGLVPYTGATGNVDLGTNNITSEKFIKNGGTTSELLAANGDSTVAGRNINIVSNTIDVDIPPFGPPVVSTLGATQDSPKGIAIDSYGNIYTTNYNSNSVSKITPQGITTSFPSEGIGPKAIAIDSLGNLYVANTLVTPNVTKITPEGTTTIFNEELVGVPFVIIVDPQDNVYIAIDAYGGGIAKIEPDGTTTSLPTVGYSRGIAIDSLGNIYTTKYWLNQVIKIEPNGTTTLFATTGPYPGGIVIDSLDNLYVVNTYVNYFTKIEPNGTTTQFGSINTFSLGVIIDSSDNIYTTSNSNTVIKTKPDGTSAPFATVGGQAEGIVMDLDGNIYTANTDTDNVSKITPDRKRLLAVDDNLNIIRIGGTSSEFVKGDGSLDYNTYLTQQSVLQYPDLASFPVIGASNTIYIALDTDLAYSWDGSAYTVITAPVTGITGLGTINYLPRFTSPTTIGNSVHTTTSQTLIVNNSGRVFIDFPTCRLSVQRAQSQIDFNCGNPGYSQPSFIVSDNQTDGFEIRSKGELALKTGVTYANEGLRVFSTGKLKFTQTPDTGTTSDFVLLRDTSGNVKQIAYPAGYTSPLTTKGDIFVRSTLDTRLGVGNDTQILAADSAEPTGLKWINVPATGVTSVGLSMPSAFTITPGTSPITTSGTIAVTGAGDASQYIRGDGTLATYNPGTGGGGNSVSYYLNGSVNQTPTIGGLTYKQMSKTPVIIGAGTDFTINADGYIQSFITDIGTPNQLLIPGGNWNFEMWFSADSNGGSPKFYIDVYTFDGTTLTSIGTSSAVPENITGGTAIDLYTTAVAVTQTTLTLTDRIVIRVYVIHSSKTIKLHTEGPHLCQVITTFTTGLTALNGLTDQVQNFATPGTSGTAPNWNSVSPTHTLNIPLASASSVTAGLISKTEYDTFNGKQGALIWEGGAGAGQNIKTVAGQTLLGTGNVSITTSFTTRQNANNSGNPSINYCGVALGQNIPIGNAVWTIRRLTISAAGVPVVATATGVAWTNRQDPATIYL